MRAPHLQRLLEDDEFVDRIARATGIRTWADTGDLWDIDPNDADAIRATDDWVRDRAIGALREKLTDAFEGYVYREPDVM